MIHVLTHRTTLQILTLLTVMTVIGTVLFVFLEDWTPVQALYFTVATMTTVGYGDLVPTTDASRFVATVYMVTIVPIMLVAMGVVADAVYSHRVQKKKR